MSAHAVVSEACRRSTWQPDEHVVALAVGKAASAMAHVFAGCNPEATGLVIGTHGDAPPQWRWIEASHPVPDERSEQAAAAALALASGCQPGDRFLVMVSGGASSLMALPAAGLTLADKQQVTARLLAEGADITALNCVRKHLSAIKGGRLAQACPAAIDAWLLSDVVGDDPAVIGSGPTVPDRTTFAEALHVLERFGGVEAFPARVVDVLRRGQAGGIPETPKRDDDLPKTSTRIIGSARTALEGAARAAESLGYEVVRRSTPVVGEAVAAADAHLAWMRDTVGAPGRRICVLSSGETTVRVTGSGRGGRNQEFALAAAIALGEAPWRIASVGTDGVDGPTDAAGAWVDRSTIARARQESLDPMAYLRGNDSWSFFDRVGGHIKTGPTDTNVGDIQVALVDPHFEGA